MYHRQQMRTQRWTLDIGDDVFVHAIGGEYCKGTRVRVTLSRRSTVQYLSQRSHRPVQATTYLAKDKPEPDQTRGADSSARRANEAILQSSVSDTVRNTTTTHDRLYKLAREHRYFCLPNVL